MRRLLVVFALWITPLAAQADEAMKREAIAAVHAFANEVNAGRFANAGQVYDRGPDFHWVEQGQVAYESGAAAAAALLDLGDGAVTPTLVYTQLRAAELGPGAMMVSGRFNFSLAQPEGLPIRYGGWVSIAMSKRGGRWYFMAGHTSPLAMR